MISVQDKCTSIVNALSYHLLYKHIFLQNLLVCTNSFLHFFLRSYVSTGAFTIYPQTAFRINYTHGI